MTEAEPTTGHGNVPISVQALKAGAVECLTEPVGDQIRLDTIGQAVECEVWPASSLYVFPMHVPLLRERPEDIPVLVRHFTHQYARRLHKPTPTIPAEVLAALIRYPWPGNVRELQNVTQRAVILCHDGVLRLVLPEWPRSGEPSPTGRKMLEDVQREYVLQVLRETRWVIGGPYGAAARLGLKRTTLLSKMARLGIVRQTP